MFDFCTLAREAQQDDHEAMKVVVVGPPVSDRRIEAVMNRAGGISSIQEGSLDGPEVVGGNDMSHLGDGGQPDRKREVESFRRQTSETKKVQQLVFYLFVWKS